MAVDSQIHDPHEAIGSASEVERLLAEVASQSAGGPHGESPERPKETKEKAEPYDLGNATFLSPRQLRKLQVQQEGFMTDLGERLSGLLRTEIVLKVGWIKTASYRRLEEGWVEPSHLTVFKADPLRGHGVLEIPTRLGLTMVERLLGGPGTAAPEARHLSEIENGLLEQIVQIILGQWCAQWSRFRELKLAVLGHETNGRFLQATSPQTNMLAISVEVEIGEVQERFQLVLPYLSVEPLIRQLTGLAEALPEATVPTASVFKWNQCFDEVAVKLSADWPQLEVAAGDVLQLKVGDVLRVNGECAQNVTVRIGDLPKFIGRLGTADGKWAVELTRAIKS